MDPDTRPQTHEVGIPSSGDLRMNRLEDDLLATLAGAAVVDACGGGKKIACTVGVDESNGRRWARGEPANPVNRVRQMIEKATDPWAIVAFLVAIACRAMLRKEGPMMEWRWRSLYLDACKAEQPHDGAEDCVTQLLLVGQASVADQFHADTKVTAALLRRLALGFVGQQNGWSVVGVRAH